MTRRLITTILLMLLMLSVPAALAGDGQSTGRTFNFHKGQTVYISAFSRSYIGYRADYPNTDVGYICNNEIGYEGKLREEFAKLQYFRIAERVSDAEFVFLVYVQYSAAEGFSLSADKYNEWKGKSDKEKLDIDALREGSYKGVLAGPFKIPTTGKVCSQLAGKFHALVAH